MNTLTMYVHKQGCCLMNILHVCLLCKEAVHHWTQNVCVVTVSVYPTHQTYHLVQQMHVLPTIGQPYCQLSSRRNVSGQQDMYGFTSWIEQNHSFILQFWKYVRCRFSVGILSCSYHNLRLLLGWEMVFSFKIGLSVIFRLWDRNLRRQLL